MDALVMCGGRGTRLEAETEKPLAPIAGRPMIERVLAALERSRVEAVYGVASPNAPRTRSTIEHQWKAVGLLETPGEGYVDDLQYALERVDTPVLTVAADLPLLTAASIDGVLDRYHDETGDQCDAVGATVCVPRALPDRLGVRVDEDALLEGDRAGSEASIVATGVNVVGDGDRAGSTPLVVEDPRLAVNVNYPADAALAEQLLSAERIADHTGDSDGGGPA